VNGHYEPGNLRWAVVADQVSNKRNILHVELNGERIPLKRACVALGLNYLTVYMRMKRLGITAQEALDLSLGKAAQVLSYPRTSQTG
jgi:hypothetical protein